MVKGGVKRAREAEAARPVVVLDGVPFSAADIGHFPQVETAAFCNPARAVPAIREAQGKVDEAERAAETAERTIAARRRASRYTQELVKWVAEARRHIGALLGMKNTDADWRGELVAVHVSLQTFSDTFADVAASVTEDTERVQHVFDEMTRLVRVLREAIGVAVRSQPVMPMQMEMPLLCGRRDPSERRATKRMDKRAAATAGRWEATS